MTSEEALTLIESASDPRALFGEDPARQFRKLARLTHPDTHPGNRRTAEAFAKLATLWQRRGASRPGRLVAAGDLANLYEHELGLLKIARDPADNDLIEREAGALTTLRAKAGKRHLPYVPDLVESQLHKDPATGTVRRANVIAKLEGFVTLAEVKAAYPDGLDPRDAAWMWRRLLVAIGLAGQAGLIHAAVIPEHVLIHPGDHGLVLVDWCYAITGPAGRPVALPARYSGWYPQEIRDRQPAGPDLDIYLASKCLADLIGDGIPKQLAAFVRGCTLTNPSRRPRDAWRLLGELDEILGRLYGARKFREFTMKGS